MSETPPPPRHPPPDESPIQSPRTVTFQLNNSTSFFDEFAITQETFRQEIEGFKSGDVSTPTFSTTCQFRFDSPGISLTPAEREKEHFDLIGDDRESRMIIEEVVSSAAAAKIASTSNNSLDSLSECGQAHSTQPPIINHNNNNNDRSQSLGDLLIASQQQQLEESNRNGSFDTLMSKGLSDSGIGAFPRDDNLSPSTNTGIMDYISSPDSISSMSFGYFDPSSFSNENANPLDGCNSRTSHYDERKPQPELAAISEESEHETTSNYHYPAPTTTSNYHSASVDKDRDIIEHSYPMTHCSSAPTNTAFSSPTSSSADKQQSYFNNNIAHRRVVSDEVTDTTTLKRSKEMENVDKIGSYEYEVKANQNLKKKGRCKSLMFIVQGSGDELTSEDENQIEEGENEEEEDDIDGGGRIGNVADTRDNDLLIYNRNIESSPRRNLYEKNPSMPCSNEPPPVRLSRKVSASSTRSTPIKTATDQSWKDKMPPFSMSGHNMYSPQSLPSRDAIPRSPFDGSGTFTSRLPYTPLPNLIIDDIDTCSDGKLIMSELSDDLPPLSSIYRPRTPSLSSTATDCMNRSPEPNNNLNEGSPSSQTSFVRRGLRKIMKRSSASAGALIDMDGPRGVGIINQPGSTNSLKRRASAASSSLIASASAHLKPRAKSLKKQRLGKPNKKEKSGSDTFTFNFFRRKQQAARPNLTDIISDLDQRSTSTRNLTATTPTDLRAAGNLAASNRRSTSASILPMSDGGTGFDANSFDG
ncbi:unnamed protein product [Caenorhabditis angaria]|uniref:Uncharacterized protein n=1 Tax=Caenorhabditis angaria TaxID=860376 RepID=A0A9P1I3A5_9PELO|nr:unnamed protein product [Caenorhabditis angaria]